MFKKLMRFTVIGATVFALAACGNQQGAGDMGTNGMRGAGTMGAQGIGANSLHNNRNLSVNRDIARAVESINGVSRANVLLGERNAYVAVVLDGTQRGNGGRTTGGNNGTGNGTMGSLSARGTGNHTPGYNGLFLNDGVNGRGQTGMGSVGPIGGVDMGGVDGYGRYVPMGKDTNGIGNGQSGRIGLNRTGMLGTDGNRTNYNGTNLHGINRGNANNTNLNDDGAGTAGTPDYMDNRYMNRRGGAASDGNLSSGLRAEIDRLVRAKAGDKIRNVFVSANPGFVRQMDVFVSQLNGNGRNGNGNGLNDGRKGLRGWGVNAEHQTQGLVNGFNQFVQTIFIEPFDNDNRFGDNDNRFGWDNPLNNRTNLRSNAAR